MSDTNLRCLHLLNPSIFNHTDQKFDILSDDMFMSILHNTYTHLETLIDISVVIIPSITDLNKKRLDVINIKLFDNKLVFIEAPQLYSTTYNSNMNSFRKGMVEYKTEISKILDKHKINTISSDFDFDLGMCDIAYRYLFNDNNTFNGNDTISENFTMLSEKYGYDGEPRKIIDFLYHNPKFDEALIDLYTENIDLQIKDLVVKFEDKYKVAFFDGDIIYGEKELKDMFSNTELLNDIDTLLITNQTDIDDSTSLSLLFEYNDGNKNDCNMVILDKTDDVDKHKIKYVLAKHKENVTYIGTPKSLSSKLFGNA